MKKLLYFVFVTLFFSLSAFAQTEGINFQGLARNAAGEVLVSQQISLRLSVLLGSESGAVAYVETRLATTNPQGVFAVVVGDGNAISKTGNFSSIEWGTASKFIKVEMDPNAGNNFLMMGTTRMQAVPFAFYAYGVDAENVKGILPLGSGGTGVASISELKTSLAVDQINNTSDASKPISTATQAALNTKANDADVTSSLATKANASDVTTSLATKVDKVTGKELSTNDYTTAEKTKLAAITGTNTGDQDLSALATNTALALKANTADVMTSLATKANASDVTTSLATKVDKVAGKELSTNDYTTAEKAKLAAITGTNTGDQDLSGYATTTQLATKANAADVTTSLATKATTADVTTSLATKVDKVTGKELSTNDYTTAEKDKLAAITGSNTGDQDLSALATNTALALKANTADVNNSLSLKANVSSLSTVATSGSYNDLSNKPTIPSAYSLPIADGINLGGVKVGSNLNIDVDGVLTANINAGTLTGTTLAANVVNSSLTSVGTLTSGTISLTTDIATTGALKAGTVTYPNTHGTSGQVLSTTGSGTLSWTSIPSPDLTDYVTTNTAQTITASKTFSSSATATNNLALGTIFSPTLTAAANNNILVGVDINPTFTNGAFTPVANYGLRVQGIHIGRGGGNLSFNLAVGSSALFRNTTGNTNVAIGNNSLTSNTVGNNNTAIGNNTLTANTVGDFNTAIGNSANVASNNLTNATALGYGAKVSASNTIQLGADGTFGTVAITNVKTSGTLTAGTVTYPNADNGINGQVLITDGYGLASFGSIPSATNLATPRNIYGGSFDGSADITNIIESTYGGTGNGFTKFSGPTGSEKTFTLPDTDATILTSNTPVTVAQGGTGLTAAGSDGDVLTSIGGSLTWTTPATISIGAIAGSSDVNGASITSGVLNLAPADETYGGVVTTGAQTFAGAKTFSETTTFSKDALINGLTFGRGGGNISTNTASGSGALGANTNSGVFNTANGWSALSNNTDGIANTAIGAGTLNSNTTGEYNTASGGGSLNTNTVGKGNTANGYLALNNNTIGNNNTAIGTLADVASNNLTNATAIGYGARVSASNTIQLGADGNTTDIDGNTIIPAVTAVKTPGTLTAGTVTYPNAHNSTGGQVLTIDNAGTATWAAAAGGVPYTGATQAVDLGLFDLTVNGITVGLGGGNGSTNTAIGFKALFSNQTGSMNTAIGNNAGSSFIDYDEDYNVIDANNTTSDFSVYLGSNSKASADDAQNEVVIGYNARGAGSNTIQLGNTAITDVKTSGNLTVNGITVGRGSGNRGYNTALGNSALLSNTTGDYNTASGHSSLASNTTGGNNTAIGYYALAYNTEGSDNIAIGLSALQSNTEGSGNTAIGNYANVKFNNLTNATAIGYGAQVSASNTIQLGADGTTSDVNGYIPAVTAVNTSGTVNAAGYTATVVNGNSVSTASFGVAGLTTPGSVTASSYVTSSDLRLKSNISPLASSLATVMQLNPVHYMKKSSLASTAYTREENGFIAQEIQKILPFIVTEGTDENKLLSVDYNSFIPMLTKAIQEQQKQIEDQNSKIAAQQKQIEELIKLVKGQ